MDIKLLLAFAITITVEEQEDIKKGINLAVLDVLSRNPKLAYERLLGYAIEEEDDDESI